MIIGCFILCAAFITCQFAHTCMSAAKTTSILECKGDLIFGVTFSRPSSIITLYQQHLYCLFLLLYLHGDPKHKEMTLGRVKDTLECFSKRNSHHLLQGCQKCKRQSAGGSEETCKQVQVAELKIKLLQFLQGELTKRNKKKHQVHTQNQKQFLRKASILMLEHRNSAPAFVDLNFYSFAQIACLPLGASCKLKSYQNFRVLQFYAPEFAERNISVFIEMDLNTEAYYYVKKRMNLGSDYKMEDMRMPGAMDSNHTAEGRNLGNSSFWNLLKVETSIQVNEQELRKLNETLNERTLEQGAQCESKIIDEDQSQGDYGSYLDQSEVLENISRVGGSTAKVAEVEEKADPKSIRVTYENSNEEQIKENEQKYKGCISEYSEQQDRTDDQLFSLESKVWPETVGEMEQSAKNSNNYRLEQEFGSLQAIKQLATKSNYTLLLPLAGKSRERRNSDTINEKTNFTAGELSHLVESVQFGEKQPMYEEQAGQMLESRTVPLALPNNIISNWPHVEEGNDNVRELIDLVMSGRTQFDEALMSRFSIEDIVLAIQELEDDQTVLSQSKVKQEQGDNKKEDKKEYMAAILGGIFRHQKEDKIAELIEKASRKLRGQGCKEHPAPSKKRGQELVKYEQSSQQRWLKKQKQQKLLESIMSEKGIQGVGYLDPGGRQENCLGQSRLLRMSKHETSLQLKHSKYFIKMSAHYES